jgi:hypothetical protein
MLTSHLFALQVLCTMAYERASAAPLYHYAGVLVTGDHPILHAGRWIHAANTPGAQPALAEDANAAGPLLYDLVTSGKRIYTVGGGCFSDYDEVLAHFTCTKHDVNQNTKMKMLFCISKKRGKWNRKAQNKKWRKQEEEVRSVGSFLGRRGNKRGSK